jgi:hypothetical protein
LTRDNYEKGARFLLPLRGIMRTTLAVIFLSWSTALLFADELPLTVDEISLMLRLDYSSDSIMQELSTRHFSGAFPPDAEKQLAAAKASPALLDALKSDKYKASQYEIQKAQAKVAEMSASAQKYDEQQKTNAKLAVAESREKLVQERKAEREARRSHDLQTRPAERRAAEVAKERRLAELTEPGEHLNQTPQDQDRRQARELIEKLRLDLSTGHSREQLNADLSMAAGQGPKTREVAERMRADLLSGHSNNRLKRDLLVMRSSLAGDNP